MVARTVPGAINLTGAYIIEGQTVLETTCRDFEHFCSLPAVVRFENRICVKTGWSSDTYRACYKSDVPYCTPVSEL
jgi:hypothetical protein